LVAARKLTTVAVPVKVIADAPKLMVRATLPVESRLPKLHANPLVLNPAEAVLVTVTDPGFNIPVDRFHPPVALLQTIAIDPSDTLFVLMVCPVDVAKKLMVAPVVVENATPVAAFSQLP
jgi:hypothetical protein